MAETRKESEKEIQKKIEESKKHSLKDAASVNATLGFGDAYVSPYIIAMNGTNTQVGLLTSIPFLIAPLAQLFTSKFMERYSRRKIFSVVILWQCLMWIPIILISLLFLKNIKAAPLLVVVFWTIYAACGNFATPAWSSWIGDLVKGEETGRFFGLRNRIGVTTSLIAMLLAGLILNKCKLLAGTTTNQAWVFAGFAFIFLLAMTFRLISRHYVLKQYEPEFRAKKEYYFSFFQFFKKSPANNYGRFTIYVSLIFLSANIAAPFYAVYMLRILNFTYTQYMSLIIAASIAMFIFMPIWGKFADRFGNIKTLKITGFLIPVIYFLWLVSPEFTWFFYFILLAEFFSGFAWAGFSLAVGNFVYDAATSERRSLCVAYSSVMNGVGVFIGATLGGFLASQLPLTVMTLHRLMFVSLISGVAMYIVSFIMLPKLREARNVEEYKFDWRLIPITQMPITQIPYYIFRIPAKLLGIINKKTNIRRFKK
ncbi:MAG: MFS transporter [Candidatus Omnitrophica bacterium]|nr:MFS transporter [Candidatus Omnitrophota bacterium]